MELILHSVRAEKDNSFIQIAINKYISKNSKVE